MLFFLLRITKLSNLCVWILIHLLINHNINDKQFILVKQVSLISINKQTFIHVFFLCIRIVCGSFLVELSIYNWNITFSSLNHFTGSVLYIFKKIQKLNMINTGVQSNACPPVFGRSKHKKPLTAKRIRKFRNIENICCFSEEEIVLHLLTE